MRTLIMIFLIQFWAFNFAYAGQTELDKEQARAQKLGITLTDGDRTDLLNKGWRARRSGEKGPLVRETSRPQDYVGNFDRGTVEFNPKWRNYSYHKVNVPSGTVLDGAVMGACNFTQIEPNTEAFDRTPGFFGHNLVFRNCNLSNVKTYPDWTVEESCNNAQVDYIKGLDPDGNQTIVDTVFVASRSEDVPKTRTKAPGAMSKSD